MSRRMRLASIALAAAWTTACARPGPAMQVLDATVRAVGGRPAVEATRTLVVEGEGEAFVLGQGEHPDRGNLRYRVARPHTIAPDALARHPRPLAIVPVDGELTIDDPERPVQLFAADTPHADTMLVAYLPRQRLLIEADLYTPSPPGAPPMRAPNAAALLRVVEARHLDVERVVPLHRQVVPFADLVTAARATAALP